MTVRSARVGVIALAFALAVPEVASAAAFRFDRARYQPEGLDSVAAVSGASILRAFPRGPSTYRCPTSRVWIGSLDADRTKVAYSLMPSSGGDYATSPSGRLTYAVGRGSEGGRGPTVAVFCFAHGGYPKASAVTGGFVIPPTAPVTVCTADAKRPAVPFRCR